MSAVLAVAELCERIARVTGAIAAWLLFVLVGVICIDVVTRKFNIPIPFLDSTRLQELEWHIHGALLMLCLGYGYVSNVHVRIDVLSNRFAPRTAAWVEIAGCVLLAAPLCVVVLWIGVDFFQQSFVQGERSDAATGLSYRWIIKGLIPIGMLLLLISVLGVALRQAELLRRLREPGSGKRG